MHNILNIYRVYMLVHCTFLYNVSQHISVHGQHVAYGLHICAAYEWQNTCENTRKMLATLSVSYSHTKNVSYMFNTLYTNTHCSNIKHMLDINYK